MATGQIKNICALMKRFIDSAKKGIKGKEEMISRLQERLQKLTGQPNSDSALIKEIRDDIERLERELVEDRGQLNALEEEFSAECGGS